MKESAPDHDEKKINRRKFLKELGFTAGITAGVVGLSALGVKILDEGYKDYEMHEKQGEAILLKKDYIEGYVEPVVTGKVTSVITHPEEYTITCKMGDKESRVRVSKAVYEKYNIGNKIPVKYDYRNMAIHEILVH